MTGLLQVLADNIAANDKIVNSMVAQNLNGTSTLGYSVYPHLDVRGYDLRGDNCFSVPERTANMTLVNQCRSNYLGDCCVPLTQVVG